MRRGGGQRPFVAGERRAAPLTFEGISLFFSSLGFVFLFVFVLFPGAASAAPPPVPPRPAKYVTDSAGVLAPDRAAALNEKLAAFERETSNQVIFWIDRRVPEGTTLEEFANRCAHEWGVGQKGKSNGVTFFLFTEDRKMRMEVGYGLEGAIPDARAHRIDTEIIGPLLKAGDVAGALDAGADAIFAAARGEPYKGTGRTAAETRRNPNAFWFFLPIFLPFVVVAFVLVFAAYARRRAGPAGASGWRSWSGGSSWSSSSSDSSSSSSDSSSDFSGGGGDSGGGGSSDSY
ncbi:MAG TPA: TPM domain-containing protein [Thermoanaerobaculia bacterium]|nr:TPM domain-containing protein [Thermoanaerobaculia bacterium]